MQRDEKKAFESYLNSGEANKYFTQVVNAIPVGLIPTAYKKSLEEAFQILSTEDSNKNQVEKPHPIPVENFSAVARKGIASLLNRFGMRASVKRSLTLREEDNNKPTSDSAKSEHR